MLLKRTDLGFRSRTGGEKTAVIGSFREIVGAIVLVANPLSTASLARLLGLTKRAVDSKLLMLHSVLDIPSDEKSVVKPLHLSFRDYLVDPGNRDEIPFWVDETATHKQLADKCLRLLSTEGVLKKNMCNIHPGTLLSEIDPETINAFLPFEVQYACRFWVHHLQRSGESIRDDDSVHCFLTRHFLHWLEALALLGHTFQVSSILKALSELLEVCKYLAPLPLQMIM